MNARARRIEEDMDAEFVGGALDGMRITLHVLHEEPRLTILGCTYERQGKPVSKSETECDRREFDG